MYQWIHILKAARNNEKTLADCAWNDNKYYSQMVIIKRLSEESIEGTHLANSFSIVVPNIS